METHHDQVNPVNIGLLFWPALLTTYSVLTYTLFWLIWG